MKLTAIRGGNFIDTANVYTNGTSEKFVGEFIKDHCGSVVVDSKEVHPARLLVNRWRPKSIGLYESLIAVDLATCKRVAREKILPCP